MHGVVQYNTGTLSAHSLVHMGHKYIITHNAGAVKCENVERSTVACSLVVTKVIQAGQLLIRLAIFVKGRY